MGQAKIKRESEKSMGQIHLTDKAPLELPKPGDFRCGHCNTIRPPYGFHMNGADLGVMGSVQYLTVFCSADVTSGRCTCGHLAHENRTGKCFTCACEKYEASQETKQCGAILSVCILGYAPPTNPADLLALQAAMRGGPKA